MKSLFLLLTALPLMAQQPGNVSPSLPPDYTPAPNFPAPPNDGQPPVPAVPPALREALDGIPNAFPAQSPPPAAPVPAPVPAAPAGEPKIQVQLVPNKLSAGETGTLAIRITDGRNVQNYPRAIEAPGLNIQFNGTSRQSIIVNGRMMQHMELQYVVEAVETGTHTIPAQNLNIDGKVHTTEPVTVVVEEARPMDERLQPQAQLTVGKTEMWEGEEVPITVSVLVHNSVQITSQPFPVIKSESVAVSRFDRNGRSDMREVDGQYWSAWQLPSTMSALKEGEFDFGPAEVKLEVLMPIGGGMQRDPSGYIPSARRSLVVKSNTVKVRVKPLPAKDKPEGFAGLVGNFQINARSDTPSAGAQQVVLGEPVGFDITITGTGNFDAIQAPALENGDGLRPFKPKVTMEHRGLANEFGQKTFSQILFTQKPGPHSVVFVLPYFDPASGKYSVAKSPPVELIVTGDPAADTAAAAVTAADVRSFSGPPETPVPGEELQNILSRPVDNGRWFSLTSAMIPVHPWLLHGVPAVILALLLGTGANRRLQEWMLARRPPPGAPRKCQDIAADLRRSGLTRLQFYGFISEYSGAWEFWNRRPLPSDDRLGAVLASRDHWLYASRAGEAAGPVPADEQSLAASTLTARLRA